MTTLRVTGTQQCQWDTGSMYGCQPACDRPAAVTVGYRLPCYETVTRRLCARHVDAERGRLWPIVATIVSYGTPGVAS